LTISEHFNQAPPLRRRHQAPFDQLFRSHLGIRSKALKISNINDSILFTESRIAVPLAANKRQTFGQTSLTTKEGATDTSSSTRLLTFLTTARGFASTRAVSAPNTPCYFVRTGSGSQIRKFH